MINLIIMEQKTHPARSIKMFREMPGTGQEALASDVGADLNKKNYQCLRKKKLLKIHY